MQPRIAVTAYLNNRAYFQHRLPAGCELCALYPREAIKAIAEGQLQAAVVPVAGLSALQGQVDLLGDYGIAAAGPVNSVFMFSHLPFERLASQHQIQLTSQSATSINLLALLLRYQLGERALPVALPESVNTDLMDGELLIGDDALAALQQQAYAHVTDLSERWYQHHQLPFVFARWVVRRDAPSAFRASLEAWLATYVQRETEYQMQVAQHEASAYNLTPKEVFFYLQGMQTRLDDAAVAGQQKFLSDLAHYRPEFTSAMPDLKVAYA